MYDTPPLRDNYGGYTKPWWEKAYKPGQLLYDYNQTRIDELKRRRQILEEMLGDIGERELITPPFYCDQGENVHIGRQFYSNYNCILLDGERIDIGDRVLFGPNVTVCTFRHPIHPDERYGPDGSTTITLEPVVIEDDVWIGANCFIGPGVRIGHGSVVGAGSVVLKSIPPMSVAAGVPCRTIRPITDDDRVERPL